MQLTQSEAQLVQLILRHLRSGDFTNVTINRRGGTTFVDIGYTVKLVIQYIGSVANGTEKATSVDVIVETR